MRTGVAGRAARMGHRLDHRDERVARHGGVDRCRTGRLSTLTVEADSFEVLRGEGGVKGLSGPEKVVVRSNALKSLHASRFPEIRFTADVIDKTDEGYRLTGPSRGSEQARETRNRFAHRGSRRLMAHVRRIEVRQSDYGIKPYSMLMGSVQVADDVTVSFTAVHAKDD